MSHKTLINGTAYEIGGGRALSASTAYNIKLGKTLVGNTAYTIPFTPDPITIIDQTTSYYTWTATRGVTMKTGRIQWASMAYYCCYWEDGNMYIGRNVSITCDNTFDLSRLSSVTLTYSFDQGGATNGLVFHAGRYSTTLSRDNWKTVTINCGAQSANSSIYFSWYQGMDVDYCYLCIALLRLNFA